MAKKQIYVDIYNVDLSGIIQTISLLTNEAVFIFVCAIGCPTHIFTKYGVWHYFILIKQ